ncbi:MAG: hypothetical protein RR292_01280, partial [Christensenellaceae bacterium]
GSVNSKTATLQGENQSDIQKTIDKSVVFVTPTDADAPPRKNPPIPTESDTPAAVMEYVPKPWGKDAPPKPDSENENHGIIGYDQAHGDTSNEIYNEKVLKSERSAIGSILITRLFRSKGVAVQKRLRYYSFVLYGIIKSSLKHKITEEKCT